MKKQLLNIDSMFVRVFFSVCLAAAPARWALAQQSQQASKSTQTITGVVKDATGEPLIT